MKRSVFYDGVEVYAEHMNNVETTKIEAIKNVVTTFGITGPVRGCVVAPDPTDGTKVMVTQGKGYTYGGEYYELNADVRGVGINNVSGIKSYVCIEVVETPTYPLPNVITGEIKHTMVNVEYHVRALSEAAWLQLVDKGKYSLLAIVTGSGGFVRGSDIQRAAITPTSLLFVERQPVELQGIRIVTISNNTNLGVGSIRYEVSGGNRFLSWKAPESATFGTSVSIGGDGIYKLWDMLGVSYIQVEVSVADLSGASLTVSVKVVDLLSQIDLATGTMVDFQHRSMMGSGMPSLRNPHGQTLDDFDPGKIQDLLKHQKDFHGPGIVGVAGSASLRPSIVGNTVVSIQNITEDDTVVSGGYVFNSVSPLQIDFSSKVSGLYYVYVDERGFVKAEVSIPKPTLFLIATVEWNGSFLSNLADKRRWGTTAPEKQVMADEVKAIKDPKTIAYSLADSLAMIRWMLKAITGEESWDVVPARSLKQANAIISDVATHAGLLYTDRKIIHGVRMGDGGGFDADTVDGLHGEDFARVALSNRFTGHNTFQGRVNVASHVTGTADAIAATYNPPFTAWVDGMRGVFRAKEANLTSNPVFSPDGLPAKVMVKEDLQPLITGDIAGAGHEVEWIYNTIADRVVVLNPRGAPKSQIPTANAIPVAGSNGKLNYNWLEYAQSFSGNGYVRFPNGLIIQWGSFVQAASWVGTVTFPIAFPNACFSASIVMQQAGRNTYVKRIEHLHKASMYVNADYWEIELYSYIRGGTSYNPVNIHRWIAIGY